MKLNKEFFMDFAYAKLRFCSTCAVYKVGAVVVRDHRIISHGYNGAPSKFIECAEIDQALKASAELDLDLEQFESLEELENHCRDTKLGEALSFTLQKYSDEHCLQLFLDSLKKKENLIHSSYEIHAEQNALAYALRYGQPVEGAELYVSMEPCLECAKIIIASGIKKVYFKDKYKDKRFNRHSEEFLKQSGVYVEQL